MLLFAPDVHYKQELVKILFGVNARDAHRQCENMKKILSPQYSSIKIPTLQWTQITYWVFTLAHFTPEVMLNTQHITHQYTHYSFMEHSFLCFHSLV